MQTERNNISRRNDPKACTSESQLLQYWPDYHETLPEAVFHDV
jgi:hypothetical protein